MMTFDPDLLTGVEEIDTHHRELFDRVERLLEASRAQRGEEEVLRLLQFLARYVVDHFSSEESLMAAGCCPDADAHVAEHRRFERELDTLRRQIARDGPTPAVVARVCERMTEWLRDHICRTDRALAAWLRSGAHR